MTETDYRPIYIAISITNSGVEVNTSRDDEPGAYVSIDPPHWLQGEPNHFVGTDFDEAKELALEHLEPLADAVNDMVADLRDVVGSA